MDEAIRDLKKILSKPACTKNKNSILAAKYENDTKYARITNIKEQNMNVLNSDLLLHENVMVYIKHETDRTVVNNQQY